MNYKASNYKKILNSPVLDVASFSVHKIALGDGLTLNAVPIVNVGDNVVIGQCLAEKVPNMLGDNVYSSVCGNVRKIELDKVATGKANCITIDVEVENQNNNFLPAIDGCGKDELLARLNTYNMLDKTFIENNDIHIDLSCKDKYEPLDAVIIRKFTNEVIDAFKILNSLDFNVNIYVDKYTKKILKKFIKEQSLKLNISKHSFTHFCDSRFLIDIYNVIRVGKPPIDTFMIVNGGAAKNPCLANVKVGTMVSEVVIASGGEVFPYVQYKYAENIAADTYGEYLELRNEYDSAPDGDRIELMQEIVAKRKKANKNILDFLMIEKKFKKHLMEQIVVNGYKNGFIREDFDYPVCKNTTSVLLLTGREKKPIIEKEK